MTITFGKVPYPVMEKSPLPIANPWVEEGAPPVPDAIIWHRMVGNLRGTDDWFHQGKAATAYGVGVGNWDSASDDGKIIEWIGPTTGYYGESSGPVSSPYGDGLAYVQEVGVDNVNRRSKAIEISGNYETPLTAKARQSIIAITAYWADRKKIPHTDFPMIVALERSFVIWHQEITIGSGKVCPGIVVMNETNTLIASIKTYLKRYQEEAATPDYARPAPISGEVRLFRAKNGKVFVPVKASWTTIKKAPQYQYAEFDGPKIAADLPVGSVVKVLYHVVNEQGEWVVSDAWARIPIGAFV